MERFEELSERINQFNKDRDWDQYHSPVNLAKSIAIEAGELLECFQWSDLANAQRVKEELADVFIYCLQMGQVMGFDMIEISHEKMDTNAVKYPVEKAKGVATKYDEL